MIDPGIGWAISTTHTPTTQLYHCSSGCREKTPAVTGMVGASQPRALPSLLQHRGQLHMPSGGFHRVKSFTLGERLCVVMHGFPGS